MLLHLTKIKVKLSHITYTVAKLLLLAVMIAPKAPPRLSLLAAPNTLSLQNRPVAHCFGWGFPAVMAPLTVNDSVLCSSNYGDCLSTLIYCRGERSGWYCYTIPRQKSSVQSKHGE